MADHIKQTRNAINAKKQEIQSKEHERAEWADQVSYIYSTVARVIPLLDSLVYPLVS
jgi:hypothetical protein